MRISEQNPEECDAIGMPKERDGGYKNFSTLFLWFVATSYPEKEKKAIAVMKKA